MFGKETRLSRRATAQLRTAIELMPRETREAMLDGIDRNRIVAGAYADRDSGGICPMLAAHRNGGRTDFAGFARAWDRFTDVRGPRRATVREVRTLRHHLEMSLLRDPQDERSLAELAGEIRAERTRLREVDAREALAAIEREAAQVRVLVPAGHQSARAATDRDRSGELGGRRGWSWLRPTRRLDRFRDLLAAAEEQVSEQRANEVLGERERASSAIIVR